MSTRWSSVVFAVVAATSLAACSAILGFQSSELLPDAATGDAMTRHDGEAPRDSATPEDGPSHDGGSPVDVADDTPESTPDTGTDAGCHPIAVAVTGKLVFITAMATTADFGGLAGADMICQMTAEAAGIDGSAYKFKAWLSDDPSGGSVQGRFTKPATAYKLANGTIFASSWDALTSGTGPLVPLNLTVDCQPVSGPTVTCGVNTHAVWTDTDTTGALVSATDNCTEWRSAAACGAGAYAGSADDIGPTWSKSCLANCPDEAHLYCFEQ
jgi:hypothetical protein